MRRMMARTVLASSSRSTPATPRQTAVGRIARSAIAASITSRRTFSTSSSPDACRFAGPPRASDTIVPRSSASRHTVQIRGRADAYYRDALEPRPAALVSQPAFDPLATALSLAHEAGLQVHAWINVNLVSGANELPPARDHVIYRHPEWLMVPRALAEDLHAVDPRSPGYLGRLARYVRTQPGDLEGLYLSPISDAAVEYTAAVVRNIVERYAVDGVHLDYLRYPTVDFDYSRGA